MACRTRRTSCRSRDRQSASPWERRGRGGGFSAACIANARQRSANSQNDAGGQQGRRTDRGCSRQSPKGHRLQPDRTPQGKIAYSQPGSPPRRWPLDGPRRYHTRRFDYVLDDRREIKAHLSTALRPCGALLTRTVDRVAPCFFEPLSCIHRLPDDDQRSPAFYWGCWPPSPRYGHNSEALTFDVPRVTR